MGSLGSDRAITQYASRNTRSSVTALELNASLIAQECSLLPAPDGTNVRMGLVVVAVRCHSTPSKRA